MRTLKLKRLFPLTLLSVPLLFMTLPGALQPALSHTSSPVTAAFQSDCPAIISGALDLVDAACTGTGRNQLCYGNLQLTVTPRDPAADLHFQQTGDVIDVAAVQTLQLSSFRLTGAEWGVALLKLQANLPDTLPGQNVTFLLFGDVTMSDAGAQVPEQPAVATGGVNVRLRPSTDAPVLRSLRTGETVTANGRLADQTWIRVRLDEASEGWVAADFLAGDWQPLVTVDPEAPVPGSMQAFYLKTGIGDAPCVEAPDSGILIQTPQGAGTVELRVNQVDIRLGSTVYMQAVPGDSLTVSVIDGHAVLDVYGTAQIVPAGTVATVPLDADGSAAGPPTYPVPIDPADLAALPLTTGLPDRVTLATPPDTRAIPAAIAIAAGQPPSGEDWAYTMTTTHIPATYCGEYPFVLGEVEALETEIVFSEDRSSATFSDILHEPSGPGQTAPLVLYRTGTGHYVGSYFSGTWDLSFTSPTEFAGTTIGWQSNPECSWDRAYLGSYKP